MEALAVAAETNTNVWYVDNSACVEWKMSFMREDETFECIGELLFKSADLLRALRVIVPPLVTPITSRVYCNGALLGDLPLAGDIAKKIYSPVLLCVQTRERVTDPSTMIVVSVESGIIADTNERRKQCIDVPSENAFITESGRFKMTTNGGIDFNSIVHPTDNLNSIMALRTVLNVENIRFMRITGPANHVTLTMNGNVTIHLDCILEQDILQFMLKDFPLGLAIYSSISLDTYSSESYNMHIVTEPFSSGNIRTQYSSAAGETIRFSNGIAQLLVEQKNKHRCAMEVHQM